MDSQALAKRIIEARERCGWHQAEAARRLKMPREMLCRYESGETQPSLKTLVRIAKALSTTPNTLLQDYMR